jgi:3-hydroxyacyl-[acyl-carrier-protein] dehydratase
MSVLYKEIKALYRQVSCDEDGKITAQISFPKSFTGFKGHFPGKPVLPGVCKILSVLVLLELALKRRVRLKTIVLAKFLSLVTCEEDLMVELRREIQNHSQEKVKALFRSADKKIADIQIEVDYE